MPTRPATSSGAAPVAALLGFAIVAGAFRVRAYDLFWHLAAGRWIFAHGTIPRSDPFRFTNGGVPWVDHEWLFQVVAHGLERVVGVTGLELVRIALAVGLALLLLVSLRRAGAPTAWAVVAVLAALLGARPRLFLRPELLTIVAIPVLLALLQELRRANGPGASRLRWRLAAAILLLGLLWTNAHPGALAGPPLALAFLVGSRLPGAARSDRPVPWSLVLGLPAALAGTLLLNPYGVRVFDVPAAIGASLDDLGGVNPEWLPIWHPWIARDSIYLFAVVAALVALAALTFARTRRLDPATGLVALTLAGLAATSIRHQALFHVGAAFFAGECLRIAPFSLGPSSPSRGRGTPPPNPRVANWSRESAVATALCLIATVWAAIPPSRGPLAPRQGRFALGFGVEPDRFPEHLSEVVADDWPGLGDLYNDVAWGGYLIWRLGPERRVFVDGRNEVDPEILREIAEARRSAEGWDGLLDRYRIDGAVVRYDERAIPVLEPPAEPGGRPLVTRRTPNALLFPRDRFALVAWDDAGMLLVRRTPERADRLAAEEYRSLDPEDVEWTLERAERDPAFRAEALAEAERRSREEPSSRRAGRLAGALRSLAGAAGE